MPRCKAPEIPRNEVYLMYAAMTRDAGNAADGYFSAACEKPEVIDIGKRTNGTAL